MQNVRRIDFKAGRELVARREAYAEAAKPIAAALFAAETSLETSALDLGRLQAILIEARRAAGLATPVGQPLVRTASAAHAKVVDALEAITECHSAAKAQADSLGVKMDFGAGDKGQNERFDPGA